MQVIFDTNNPLDLELLSRIIQIGQIVAPATLSPRVGGDDVGGTEAPASSPSAVSAPAPVANPDKPKRGRPRKEDQRSLFPETKPAATVEPVVDVEPIVDIEPIEEAAMAKALTMDDVRAALQAFTQSNGLDAGIALLREFGAQRISELKEDSYAAFVAGCGQ